MNNIKKDFKSKELCDLHSDDRNEMSLKLCKATTSDVHDDGGGEIAEEQQDEEQNVTLLSLVDDCFYHIFERLSMYDLCSVAQTCKRL